MSTIKSNNANSNNKKNYVRDKRNELIKLYPDFEDFYTFKLEPMSIQSRKAYLNGLSRFHDITNKLNAKELTKNDIKNFLNDEKFKLLANRTKNHYLLCLKKYLEYFERKDLIELLPRYREKNKELNKTDLISREELDFLLKNVNTKKKAMIMVNYEGALRRDELVNIQFKNVQFREGFAEVYLGDSKTVLRNIPLIESVPYLREYFNEAYFKPDDKIFDYHEQWITSYYKRLSNRLKKKYPNEWKKDLYPHLLRHSRLTELARTQLNEPQLRKFAGWTKNSQMPAVYFHLDDTDIKNILVQQSGQKGYKKPKPKTFKPIICKNCDAVNPKQNAFCYKCGHVINKDRIVIDRIQEKEDIEHLKTRNKELIEQLAETNKKVEILEEIASKTKHVLGLYNTVKELLSLPKNKRFFEFITEIDNDVLDLLAESISKASENKENIPKQKDKPIKGFNLKLK